MSWQKKLEMKKNRGHGSATLGRCKPGPATEPGVTSCPPRGGSQPVTGVSCQKKGQPKPAVEPPPPPYFGWKSLAEGFLEVVRARFAVRDATASYDAEAAALALATLLLTEIAAPTAGAG